MSTTRVSKIAPPGSLLKGGKPAGGKGKAGRQKRTARKPGEPYLRLIRRCPCLACDTDPAGEAAHVRMSAPGKPIAGIGAKPEDRWTVPLCHPCHMRQHELGEVPFWQALGLDPLKISATLWACGNDIGAMRAQVFALREYRRP